MTPVPRLPPSARGMRIGLLGGSFNPPHEGHALITRLALRRLSLDRVWWLVTPGNPLKPLTGLAALNARIEAARRLDVGPRVVVTDIEAQIGSRFTYDTLRWLKRRAPGVHFVWIMGADNLRQFHLWSHWRAIADLAPIVVVDRPGSTLKAISSPAGATLAGWRVPERDASRFASMNRRPFSFCTGRAPGSLPRRSEACANRTRRRRRVLTLCNRPRRATARCGPAASRTSFHGSTAPINGLTPQDFWHGDEVARIACEAGQLRSRLLANRLGRFAWMARVEWGTRIVFDHQLRDLSSFPACNFSGQRARSSPAETPAAVQIFPDLTIRRSGTAIAPKRLSDACAHQWVVASCPSRRLAAARISAPEHHTDAVIVLVSCALFNHSTNRPSPIAVAVLASEPGARMRNRCGVSSKECVAPMIRACDR